MKWRGKKERRKQLEEERNQAIMRAELARQGNNYREAFPLFLQAAEISKKLEDGDQEEHYRAVARTMKMENRVTRAKEVKEHQATVRTAILDLGSKFARLQIDEIVEKCQVPDKILILTTVKEMIAQGQVAAEFFESTQTVAFNLQANLQLKDKFMADLDRAFATWEEERSKLEK